MKLSLIPAALSCCVLLLLAACSQHTVTPPVRPKSTVPEPEVKLPDYLAVECTHVWPVENPDAMRNPLYWLRAMDCASRLTSAQARAEASRWPAENWARAFKQGVLLANGKVTPPERREFVDTLDSYSSDVPASVRPLMQLWRSYQAAELDLSASRLRYAHLQQSNDSQLDTLRQQQQKLTRELAETRHKLERLTDIERQLSSRKSSDLPDGNHATMPDGNNVTNEDH